MRKCVLLLKVKLGVFWDFSNTGKTFSVALEIAGNEQFCVSFICAFESLTCLSMGTKKYFLSGKYCMVFCYNKLYVCYRLVPMKPTGLQRVGFDSVVQNRLFRETDYWMLN